MTNGWSGLASPFDRETASGQRPALTCSVVRVRSSTPGRIAKAAVVPCRDSGVAATAERLQIRSVVVVAVAVDVIDDAGSAQDPAPQAFAAERFLPQHLRTQGSPRGAARGQGTLLLSLPLRCSAVPLAAIGPMRVAVARLGQHRAATGVSAGRGRTHGHVHLPSRKRLAS